MAELLTATWQVTLNGVTVLALTDYVSADPAIEQRGLVQAVEKLRADYADRELRGNVSHVLRFERHRPCSHPVQAEKYRVDHLRTLATLAKGACVITFAAGGSTTLSNAVLVRPFVPRLDNDHFVAAYEIVGSDLSATVGVPAPGSEPADPAPAPPSSIVLDGESYPRLITETGAELVTETGERITI